MIGRQEPYDHDQANAEQRIETAHSTGKDCLLA
jgi:hypothetical protein